jgi:hypothetical protein
MKRFFAVTTLALIAAAGAVTFAATAPARADPMIATMMKAEMQTTPTRGLFAFPADDRTAFDIRVASGASTILGFTKQGCPVCTRQNRALQDVLKVPTFANIAVQQVDFVNRGATARAYGLTGQSTILGLMAGREANARSGDVAVDAIRAHLVALIG